MNFSKFSSYKRALAIMACALAAIWLGVLSDPVGASEDNLKPPSHDGGHRSSGGGGGGVGISIDIGGVINTLQKQQERQQRTQPKVIRQDCPAHMVWSSRSRRCVCAKGYSWHNGACQRPPTVVKQPEPEPAVDVVEVQECLIKVGFDPGTPDGKPGRQTMAAWRDFQLHNDLRQQPPRLDDDKSLTLLFDLCKSPPPATAASPAPTPAPVAATPVAATRSATPVAQAPARCLPQDLHDLLSRTYGGRPDVPVCTDGPSICLPKPIGYTQARLEEVSAGRGVQWCESCITLGTWLPLTAVLAIEGAANITLCAAPNACALPGQPAVRTQREVRTIFRTLPRGIDNDGDIAVIVGNETYGAEAIPANANGNADADAVRTLLIEQLGFRDANIIDLRDATLADLQRVFGGDDPAASELAQRLGDNKQGDVFIYVSSHGLAQEDSKQAYLLPVDANLDQVDTSAYALQRLYDNLGKLGARSIMLFLEGNFASDVNNLVDPPNLPELSVDAMPETPVPGLAVFKASDRDQRTLQDPEYGIGLFTRYLIEGLAGKADTAPIGNVDNRIDAVELFVYTSDLVRTAARKSFGVEQKPLLSEIGNLLVGQLASAN